ncbi:MAG: hypothetical protein QOI41_3710 [Myxococcales bacterium]|jgi:hypothetical protein|nr:hypothetical protein [Myxococcales bacterium]
MRRSGGTRGERALATGLFLVAAATATMTAGCDKLGLGKKDGDGGSTGGGLGSIFDSTFEGEITVNVSSKPSSPTAAKEAPKSLLLGLKTPRVRIDAGADLAPGNPMLAGGVAFIVDPPAKKGYALITAQKKAVVIDFDKSKGGFKPPTGPGGSAGAGHTEEPPKIENTGKKDTVAGYTCEIWKITSKTSHAEACLAEKIKWIDLTDLAVQSPSFAAIAAVSDFNHLPLRVVSFDDKNVEEGRMEVTKVDKKKLPDNHFSVPPDFQIVELNALIASMMGGPPGGIPGGPLGAPGGPGRRPGLPPGFVPPKKAQ